MDTAAEPHGQDDGAADVVLGVADASQRRPCNEPLLQPGDLGAGLGGIALGQLELDDLAGLEADHVVMVGAAVYFEHRMP